MGFDILSVISRAKLFSVFPTTILLWAVSIGVLADPPEVDQLKQNIQFTERLVNESEAAKKIASSSDDGAKSLQAKARQLLETAKQALQKGDHNAVSQALNQAKMTMFQAMRSGSVGAEVKSQKRDQDFKRRLASAEALLASQRKYAKENNLNGDAIDTARHVEEALLKARKQFDQGQYDSANQLVEDAYLSIKLSLTKLRTGQTIVRSLHFATKEEEYKYELDRNNTHNMLVEVVLKEKLAANPRLSYIVDMNMKIARDLRVKAEQQANSGDFEAAIKTLEDSTGQIIRAIRAAGIYIPG